MILFLTWGIVFASGHLLEVKSVSRYSWIFLALSGISTGLSWLLYFKAIQIGDASHELQTPLAVMRIRLDLLLQRNLDKETLDAINELYNANRGMEHLNRTCCCLQKSTTTGLSPILGYRRYNQRHH